MAMMLVIACGMIGNCSLGIFYKGEYLSHNGIPRSNRPVQIADLCTTSSTQIGVPQWAMALYIKIGGGVTWSSLVDYCLPHNLGGIENLSLIPGTVGAAPIQNIGAYGVELSTKTYRGPGSKPLFGRVLMSGYLN
ncbi:hypothetical protein ACN38_g199 [Penicillium nordicum]|uniref:FAD-binding PCMH-type domain-containing protein n=1 Tax=Penicillium nordicum TaxID=229535 RepID=A0A0N0S057_9EURO|nr:hypothetical protein ACN38_g199 [Penicillium nordicum]